MVAVEPAEGFIVGSGIMAEGPGAMDMLAGADGELVEAMATGVLDVADAPGIAVLSAGAALDSDAAGLEALPSAPAACSGAVSPQPTASAATQRAMWLQVNFDRTKRIVRTCRGVWCSMSHGCTRRTAYDKSTAHPNNNPKGYGLPWTFN